MRKMLDGIKAYKELLAAIAVMAGVSAYVARGVASEAVKKADATAQALLEVAKTQTALAETQQQLGLKRAEDKGRLDALLASLNLNPDDLARLQALPQSPRRLPKDTTRLACGQMWLTSNAARDTILLCVINDSCKLLTYPIYPQKAGK